MKKNELKIVNALLAIGQGSLPPQPSFDKMAATLADLTMAERVALYLESRSGEGLVLAAETRPEGKPPSPERLAREEGWAGDMASLVTPVKKDGAPALHPVWAEYPVTVATPFILSRRRGLLAVFAHRADKIKALSTSFWKILGETAGLVIQQIASARISEETLQELKLLQEIGQTTRATIRLDELLPRVGRRIVEVLALEASEIAILIPGAAGGPSTARYAWPAPPERSCPGISTREAESRLLSGGPAAMDLPCGPAAGQGSGLLLTGFPLVYQQEVIGAVLLLHREPFSAPLRLFFEGDRKSFVEAMATELSMATANALNYAVTSRLAAENANRAKELSLLFEISRVLAGTMRPDDVLKVILTAATHGHGLGFNRAALYLINENTMMLQGMLGVGPESSEEASRVWADSSLRDLPLEEVLRRSTGIKSSNAFDADVKGVRLPVAPESGVLALSALEKHAINVTDAHGDPRVSPALRQKLGWWAFAAAPMMAEGKVLGVITVDNLYNGRPIADKELQLLSTFANLAGQSLLNAQLYNRLENTNLELKNMSRRLAQSERLAALGEMAATVAHEVRNPLVSVGGFARRMERRLDAGDPNRRYTDIILKEINRLEKFLDDILIFSRELPSSPGETDLNWLVQELSEFFGEELAKRKISLGLDLAGVLPMVRANPEQISQILINFFTNSMDAMKKGGKISIRTLPPDKDGQVGFSFTDDGGGVPEELLCRIFDPFFTTKKKGTGLGLSLIHKMVRSHNGSIAVDNRPGDSVTFTVRLPAADAQKTRSETKEVAS